MKSFDDILLAIVSICAFLMMVVSIVWVIMFFWNG